MFSLQLPFLSTALGTVSFELAVLMRENLSVCHVRSHLICIQNESKPKLRYQWVARSASKINRFSFHLTKLVFSITMSGHKALAISEVVPSPTAKEQESATFYKEQHYVVVAKIDFPPRTSNLSRCYWINGNEWGKWKDSKRGFKSGICMMNEHILISSALNYNELWV